MYKKTNKTIFTFLISYTSYYKVYTFNLIEIEKFTNCFPTQEISLHKNINYLSKTIPEMSKP